MNAQQENYLSQYLSATECDYLNGLFERTSKLRVLHEELEAGSRSWIWTNPFKAQS